MAAREWIYRLKDFPADAEVAVALVLEPREAEGEEPARKAVVRIVGAEG